MSLNPLTIAHLGIARRPIVAALLGIWDELMKELTAVTGSYVVPAAPRRIAPRQRPEERPNDDDEVLLMGVL